VTLGECEICVSSCVRETDRANLLDGMDPYRVRDRERGVVAMAYENVIEIETESASYQALEKALKVGVRALELLPDTPLEAAGFNIKFQTAELSDALIQLMESDVDQVISDLHHTIAKRSLTRSFDFDKGGIEMSVSMEGSGARVTFNFHRHSDICAELTEWLRMSVNRVRKEVKNIVSGLGLKIEEDSDGSVG